MGWESLDPLDLRPPPPGTRRQKSGNQAVEHERGASLPAGEKGVWTNRAAVQSGSWLASPRGAVKTRHRVAPVLVGWLRLRAALRGCTGGVRRVCLAKPGRREQRAGEVERIRGAKTGPRGRRAATPHPPVQH